VFSPYYALARRRGHGNPLNFCALNVALYRPSGKRWAMTERGAGWVRRAASSLAIGPSIVSWDGSGLTVRIEETTVPFPLPLQGVIRVFPKTISNVAFSLDAGGRHRWQPIAPRCYIEVRFKNPNVCWRGEAYVDSNYGDEPLEDAFRSWTWSRANLREGVAVLYDVTAKAGAVEPFALLFAPSGALDYFKLPPKVALPPTRWGIVRETFVDGNNTVEPIRTLESGPFYARSLISTSLRGQRALAVHESLSLSRFRAPWVQAMLPFRMPRALNWRP
jgi:carotenoid 1,2-hydratase